MKLIHSTLIVCTLVIQSTVAIAQYDPLKGQEAERLRHKSNNPITEKPTSASYDYKAFYWSKKRNGTSKYQYLTASYLISAVSKDPNNTSYQIELGNFYIDAFNEFVLSEKCFRTAVDQGAKNFEVFYKLSLCCYMNGNILDATDFFADAESAGLNMDSYQLKQKLGLDSIVDFPKKLIGQYEWTLSNLDVEKFRNGDVIPYEPDPIKWSELKTGAWCYLDNKTENGKRYGKLYNWYAVNDPRGLAPAGYHIPSNAEWLSLISHFDGKDVENSHIDRQFAFTTSIEFGKKLRSARGWYTFRSDSLINDHNGTNISGFSALPGGSRGYDGTYQNNIPDTESGIWWSTSNDLEIESDAT